MGDATTGSLLCAGLSRYEAAGRLMPSTAKGAEFEQWKSAVHWMRTFPTEQSFAIVENPDGSLALLAEAGPEDEAE